MKQFITVNQMGDLTLVGIEVFKKWYTDKGYFLNNRNGLPTIGQLVEFIIEKGESNTNVKNTRKVQLYYTDVIIGWDSAIYKELIDHLWDITVYICNSVGKHGK